MKGEDLDRYGIVAIVLFNGLGNTLLWYEFGPCWNRLVDWSLGALFIEISFL